ncbi:DinB/UmuC family translesion DNA polymerase [Alicyclobacillus cycloheptanicus]|uniref:DinB/UmuC family translesion DNA polymerase n=1 Tax=Alicyclobacillus cycloheptanicus TaxID=1457 RepID=UPI002378FB8B|nr:hypothetical protein [Alicyclobacillus cycloheptanicus]
MTLPRDLYERDEVAVVILKLLNEVCRRLRKANQIGRRVGRIHCGRRSAVCVETTLMTNKENHQCAWNARSYIEIPLQLRSV